MITVSFYKQDGIALGVRTERGILDVQAAASRFTEWSDAPVTIEALIDGGDKSRQLLDKLTDAAYQDESLFLQEEELELAPVVPKPSKIVCVGLNYRKHADECNLPYPETPILFSKFANALAGHGEDVPLPKESEKIDYEAELAIVIGKRASNVTEEEALSYVYGYCSANDVSARDLQFATSQWLLGKTCDKFCPIGPYLVSADEVGNPDQLQIRTYVNGELRQNSNTSDMIFSCSQIISYISRHFPLLPGDVILTGTPEGVITGFPVEKQVWLKDQDVVSVEIEKLGRLTNTFRQA
ncbi:fumarylacetoacetate hydrolase family protein [Brevibacillus centrosporus]|uniref:fumarylacetoacetate hydrolase family protein n=1 Tax=Brevibacillus centrosporus TaxID=54910 RepID=UPI000F09E878|nr:fumarylacetoacetate hydrolase family protein [Brevibacillus centrosporus]MEC2132094.1 fumarylacetoacetate hydrolase family protein [Brevibacillus centrosporus]RNB68686.1 FAA hydrolase family protein [Brevibacillus centrosporus]GED31712.1 2-hydroxyhepta-2,4-diene-1,7-dioate isomerase [Brevibacillus centrosporus]